MTDDVLVVDYYFPVLYDMGTHLEEEHEVALLLHSLSEETEFAPVTAMGAHLPEQLEVALLLHSHSGETEFATVTALVRTLQGNTATWN